MKYTDSALFSRSLRTLFLLVATFCFGVQAQSEALRITPGGSVAPAGDVDGDSIEDLVVASRVHSGVSGALLVTVPSAHSIGLGDANADGFGDLVLWDFAQTAVSAWSPATGVTLWNSMAPLGPAGRDIPVSVIADVNADGVRDVMVGSVTGVRMLSGATGSVIWSLPNLAGVVPTIRKFGDINASGTEDFFISVGQVFGVYDGGTGGFITGNGRNSWPVGDANGDGFDDVVTIFGAMDEYNRWIYLGPALSISASFASEIPFLGTAAPVGDWDNDGADECYWFSDRATEPAGHQFSFQTGTLTLARGPQFLPWNNLDSDLIALPWFGGALARLSDLNADGRSDFAIGSHPADPPCAEVRVYHSTLRPATSTSLGGGCGASSPPTLTSGLPALGHRLSLRSFVNGFAGAQCSLYVGPPASNPPTLPGNCIPQIFFPDLLLLASSPADAFSVWGTSIDIPLQAVFSGVSLDAQLVILTPSQSPFFQLSTALRLQIDGWL